MILKCKHCGSEELLGEGEASPTGDDHPMGSWDKCNVSVACEGCDKETEFEYTLVE